MKAGELLDAQAARTLIDGAATATLKSKIEVQEAL